MPSCFNWKVVAGLAAVGLGVWLLAPEVAAGLLPVLLVACCPLSMLLMLRRVSPARGTSRSKPAVAAVGRGDGPRAGEGP